MLSKTMAKALNDQLNAEMSSSYLYLSMSAYFKSANLDGFAHWMATHSREEWDHALKVYDYLYAQRGRVTLQEIKAPPADWKSPLEAFQAAFNAEVETTARINNLVALSQEEKDYASLAFLQWFVTEQVEEEALFDGIVRKLKMIGDHPPAVLMLDRVMGERS